MTPDTAAAPALDFLPPPPEKQVIIVFTGALRAAWSLPAMGCRRRRWRPSRR